MSDKIDLFFSHIRLVMLEEIDLLARAYLKTGSVYRDGLIGSPFYETTNNNNIPEIIKGVEYVKGLITGHHNPEFITDYFITRYAHASDIAIYGNYTHKKWFMKYIPMRIIEEQFFNLNKDKHESEKLLQILVKTLRKCPEKYDDILIYRLMSQTQQNHIDLLKFDNVYSRDEDETYALMNCSDILWKHRRQFKAKLIEVIGPIVKSRETNKVVNDILRDFMSGIRDEYESHLSLTYKIIKQIRKYGDMTILMELVKYMYFDDGYN